MLAYKYTNIKIQLAIIKQIIYTYLFNVFLVSPNSIIKSFLTNFSKDKINTNSKEKFLKFIEINKDIEDGFYDLFSSNSNPLLDEKLAPIVDQNGHYINEKATLGYMYLTCLLNKNSQINFDELSLEEIRERGKQELKEIFFDVFLEFVNDTKKNYKINLDDIPIIKTKQGSYDITTLIAKDIKNSVEGLINSSFFVETINNLDKISKDDGAVFIPQIDGKKGSFSENRADIISQLYYLISSVNNNDYSEEENAINLYTLSGANLEYYYKIKKKINIKQSCGDNFKENPIIVSIRDFNLGNKNFEALCGQSFIDWKNDKSYKNLEQFIFYREPNLNKKLQYSDSQKGLIIKDTPFDKIKYYGATLLNKEEISTLEEKLVSSGDSSGFLALVPINNLQDTDFNNLSSNLNINLKLFFSLFNDDEKSLNLSCSEVAKILGIDCFNGSYGDNLADKIFNLSKGTFNEIINLPQDYVGTSVNYFSNSPYDANYLLENIKTLSGITIEKINPENFDPKYSNNLIFYDQIKIKEMNQKFNINDLFDLYFRVSYNNFIFDGIGKNPQDAAASTEKLKQNKLQKKGKFLVLAPEITLHKTNIAPYLYIEKNILYEEKINKDGDQIFFTNQMPFYDLAISTYFITDISSTEPHYFLKMNLEFVKQKYFNKIILSFEKEEKSIKEIKAAFISESGEFIDFSVFNFGSFDIDKFKSIKNLRSYKNFTDFITYYKNTVEGLMMEVQDRV